MKLTPLHDRVLVKREEQDAKSAGGIIIPDTVQEKPMEGKVIAVGSGARNEDGKVGWSQPAGGGPGKVTEADTSKFGTGIFLLAASEIHLLFANEGNKQ